MLADNEPRWFKSSHSTADDQCVEVAVLADGSILLRDSKISDTSPTLAFTPAQWRTFLAAARP